MPEADPLKVNLENVPRFKSAIHRSVPFAPAIVTIAWESSGESRIAGFLARLKGLPAVCSLLPDRSSHVKTDSRFALPKTNTPFAETVNALPLPFRVPTRSATGTSSPSSISFH